MPVIETGVGNCHVYLHEDASVDRSVAIVVNSRPSVSVCSNTAEALLVHEAAAERLLPEVFAALKERGVTIHGDEISEKYAQSTGISFRRPRIWTGPKVFEPGPGRARGA